MLPRAEMKKRIPARTSDRLRPSRDAKMPLTADPMMQPMRALAQVKPCIASVYWKSSAPMKNACSPFSAPEITAVS